MPRFDKVDTSPDLKRLKRVYLNQLLYDFQQYIDDAPRLEDGRLEGLDNLLVGQAVDLLNDILLYMNDGETLDKKVLA
jgi:hypothetical protein